MLPSKFWIIVVCIFVCAPLVGADPGDHVLVKAKESLTLRTGPSFSAKAIEKLITYEPLTVKQLKGDWTEVKTRWGKTGWVLSEYLSKTPFVSISLDKVQADQANVREGPGTQYDRFMKLSAHVPLLVLSRDRATGWLEVADLDGDRGFVSPKVVCFQPFVITQLEESRIRERPGTVENNPVLFRAERMCIFRVLGQSQGWLNVRFEDGSEGWISSRIVFGWLGPNVDHTGFPKKIKS